MSPAEAARTLDAAKALASARGHLRLVSSNGDAKADGPGQILQNLRLDQGLSIHQVAAALKLKPDQVAAIEEADFSRLPGLGYALGYVRAYVELMGVEDATSVIDAFRGAWEPEQRLREAAKPHFSAKYAAPISLILAIAAAIWFILFVVLQAFSAQKDSQIAPPDAQIKAWANTAPASVSQATADIRPLSTLKAIQDVRVTLRGEDGALVTDRILRAGEEVSTDGLGRWFVSAPYGGALEAHGYGQSAIIGEAGSPVKNWRVPNFAQMAADQAKAAEQKRLAEAATQ